MERHEYVVLQDRVRPGPSNPGGGANVLNGLVGPAMRKKKNAVTANITNNAQANMGSVTRLRNLRATTAT